MTPEQQRIKIAEAIPGLRWEVSSSYDERWVWPSGEITGPPDDDLNAMHEAEKVLTDEEYIDYTNRLSEAAYHLAHELPHVVITRNTVSPTATQRAEAFLRRNTVSPTATQRAEAFLRTIGKWVKE